MSTKRYPYCYCAILTHLAHSHSSHSHCYSHSQSRFTSSVSPTLLKPKLTVHLRYLIGPCHPRANTDEPCPTLPSGSCAPGLRCTSTRAPKHIRRDGILCLSSAAAQDWSITLRLRTLLASSASSAASPKAKASPPRGPDLAEETSD
ncbi:hypothetical protein BDP81DRAFT_468814 [Colletotrichum phormii]|uniref:Uncharacterized protein n=1 Tax=Colletotrichum phormii TaxID=359342 RepID=A0AAJ0EJT1_9PEZI|nr:uncharacterized protein BDP81DRAFT_468814 [Colletotrichum phormii]KAK1641334.1 hypothetical protein BDP81DRAFT_468814 [Colletotrichum phormii]